MYDNQDPRLAAIQDRYVLQADAFFVVAPEYNGSFPGILKTFIDACSIREGKRSFSGKKVALLGVASGRAGNLRGMDHLTGVFHHMDSHVMPKAQPVGEADKVLDANGTVVDPMTLQMLDEYVEKFLEFCRKPVRVI